MSHAKHGTAAVKPRVTLAALCGTLWESARAREFPPLAWRGHRIGRGVRMWGQFVWSADRRTIARAMKELVRNRGE